MNNSNRTKNLKGRRYIGKLKSHHKKILLHIHEGLNSSKIAEKMKLSKATVSEHIKSLEYSGFLEFETHSVSKYWKLRRKGKDYCLAFFKGSDLKPHWHLIDRSHNIKLKARIIQDADVSESSDWKAKNMNNWIQFIKKIGDIVVYKSPSYFSFQLPALYYRSEKEALLASGAIVSSLCAFLEKEYFGLKIDRELMLISSQSHALEGDPAAQLAAQNGVVLQGGRVELDCSNYPEIEFTDKRYGADDFQKHLDFVESVLQGKITPNIVNDHNRIVLRDAIVKLQKKIGEHDDL